MTRRAIVPQAMAEMARDWRMSPGVLSGDHLFLTGFNGCAIDGTVPTDPVAQFDIAFEAVEMVLAEAGLGWSAVVDMTSYHVGLADHLDLFRAARAQRLTGDIDPAWTAIEVVGFATQGVIVELKVTARVA